MDMQYSQPEQKLCPACRGGNPFAAAVCMHCGTRFDGAAHSSKSKVTAGVLALLLGGLGVHKFYLGQTGAGIVYLLFCWTLIPALIALIEGIIYLTQSEQEFAAKHG